MKIKFIGLYTSVLPFFGRVSITLLFSSILLLHGSYQEYKYFLLLITIFLLLMLELIGKMKVDSINKNIFYFALFYATIGSIYIFYGLIEENPGAMFQINAYIIYPLFFTFLLRWISSENIIINLVRIILYTNVLIGIHAILYILVALNYLPELFKIDLNDKSFVGIQENHMGLSMPYLTTLIYTVPFSIFLAFAPKNKRQLLVSDFILYTGIILTLIVSFLSLRRGLILAILLAPILSYFFWILKTKQKLSLLIYKSTIYFIKFFLFVIVFISILQLTDVFDFSIIIDSIFSLDNSIKASSNEHKFIQSILMIENWSSSPVFGHGFGAVIKGVISSDEAPWAYESTYLLFLNNTGLVGLFLYSIGILWIFYKGILVYKNNNKFDYIMGGALIGLLLILIANATNPYIGKFDSMWMIFFPLAIINIYSSRKKETLVGN